jgi:hypothetical protein
MSTSRSDMVALIKERLGEECPWELAERLYVMLRADGRIYHDDQTGVVMREDVDLVAAAAAATQ